MLILDALSRWFRPRLALDSATGIATPGTAIPTASGFGLSSNAYTGLGSERDPIEYEELRRWFRAPDASQLECLLRINGVSSRICSVPAAWCTLQADDSWSVKDDTRAAKPMARLSARLGLAEKTLRADDLSRQQGNAAIRMMVEEYGRYDPARQREPLDLRAVTRLRALDVVSKAEMAPHTYQDIDGDPIPFGAPLTYKIQLQRAGGWSPPIEVHSSRLVMFSGKPLHGRPIIPPSFGWGDDSVLIGVLASLQTRGRARRGRDRLSDRLMQFIGKIAMPAGGTADEKLQAIQARWSVFRWLTSLGIFLIDQTEEIQQLNANLSGIADLTAAAWEDISADVDVPIPLPLIMGREASGLGTGSWLDAWDQTCSSRRGHIYTPRLRQVYDVGYAAAGIYDPDYTLTYAPIRVPTAIEQADERLKLLQGDRELIDMGALAAATVERSRVRAGWQRELQPALPEETPSGQVSAVPAAVQRDPVARATYATRTTDALTDGVLVALELDPMAFRPLAMSARAYAPSLRLETWPHVTLLYAGTVAPGRLPALLAAVALEAAHAPAEVYPTETGPLGDDGAQVVFLRRAGVAGLADRLLRAAAPAVNATQFPRFIPHATVGYGGEIGAVEIPPSIRVVALVVKRGEIEVGRFPVG